VPDEPAVVGVARRHDSARPAHPPHLPQRLHRIGDVLQHLVGMDDVERVVGTIERVHVSPDERDIRRGAPRGFGAGRVEDIVDAVDSGHWPGRYQRGEVGGDGTGTASDVEQGQPWLQVGQ